MGKTGLIAGILAAFGVATVAGVAISQKKPTSVTTPPPTSTYTLDLTGPTNVDINASNTYSVTLDENGQPYTSGAKIDLYIGGTLYTSGTTNSSGNVSFTVEFGSAGTAQMYASYGNTQSNSLSITVVSPPSDFTLKLSGPTSVTVNADNLTYTVLVEKNGSPYQYTAEVSLYINGKLYQNSPSDDSGYVYFGPTFSNAGTYKLYALYNNVESNELTVTATSSTSPPPSGQCSGNSGCPAESNCINGVCTPLEATDISMPDTATITGYIQYDYQSYDLVPKPSKAFTRSSYIPQCAASIDANSGLLVFTIKVNGKVLSGTAGINQAPITISSVSGGSAWSGPYKSSGTVALDVSYGDADSNGNFTLTLELEMRISVGPQVSSLPVSGIVFSPEAVDVPVYTVKVESMGLTKDIIISPNILMYAMHCLYGGLGFVSGLRVV